MHPEVENMLSVYQNNKDTIRKFLDIIYRDESDEYIFGELCFCLLTPQSKAKNCRDAVNRLKSDKKLFTTDQKELRNYLNGVRFPNVKAKRIIEARNKFPEIKKNLNLPSAELRKWLMKNVNGLGLKESAHFMRNIGFKGLPIIDFHIQNFLKRIGSFDGKIGKITKKQYLDLENRFLELARKLKIPAEELDIAIWLCESKEKNFYG